MKRLPKHMRKNGYNYTLILRGRRSCIYEQRVSESVRRYEVFLIKVRSERYTKGKFLPQTEFFPHNEAFGVWAWTCITLEAARKRFSKLEKNGGVGDD
jgi:hypothetical protein